MIYAQPVIVIHLEEPKGSGLAACCGEPFETTYSYANTPRVLCTGCGIVGLRLQEMKNRFEQYKEVQSQSKTEGSP
jgi:hypothetical protein